MEFMLYVFIHLLLLMIPRKATMFIMDEKLKERFLFLRGKYSESIVMSSDLQSSCHRHDI